MKVSRLQRWAPWIRPIPNPDPNPSWGLRCSAEDLRLLNQKDFFFYTQRLLEKLFHRLCVNWKRMSS